MPDLSRIIAGAMSGTSADGVDVALVRVIGRGLEMSASLLHWNHRPFPNDLKRTIWEIRGGAAVPMTVLAEIGREISLCYAAAVNESLLTQGLSSDALSAVAAHGQTLYHNPPRTIQWLDPALLAAEVGCPVISDFRRADCAAGGQGAPLVPLADYLLFRDAIKNRVLLNIGGIANITFLRAGASIDQLIAFDTGPGNCIIDHLMRRHDPNGPGFDAEGKLGASGTAIVPIIDQVLAAPFFAQPPPKSTDGPAMIELFSAARETLGGEPEFRDLLQTACAVSAETIALSIRKFCDKFPDEVIASGGGINNGTLMSLLRHRLGNVPLRIIDELGIASSAKEAMAFALLGAATLDGVPGNVPSATGARRAVVLGSITPKP